MIYEMVLPRLGHAMTEGEVAHWYKAVGEHVEKDEPLLDVVAQKVTVTVESPVTGIVTEIRVPDGETVPVGTIIALIKTVD